MAAAATVDAIDIACNWKIINEKKLQNSVTVVETPSSINFDDLVTLDSCIALAQLEVSELLEVAIETTNKKFSIKEIYIVSEARLLELYGKFGEYESTTNAINTEDGDEEMQVFRARLTLKTDSNHCSVKFAGLPKGKKEMWLLGVGIVLQSVPLSSEPETLAEKMGKLMQESRLPLSENAERYKKMVMSRQNPTSMESEIKNYVDTKCSELEASVKTHIDLQIGALRDLINKRLDEVLLALPNKQ